MFCRPTDAIPWNLLLQISRLCMLAHIVEYSGYFQILSYCYNEHWAPYNNTNEFMELKKWIFRHVLPNYFWIVFMQKCDKLWEWAFYDLLYGQYYKLIFVSGSKSNFFWKFKAIIFTLYTCAYFFPVFHLCQKDLIYSGWNFIPI